MANFEMATTVERATAPRGEGDTQRFRAELDPEWCVWSPAGGYLVALALRAAGLATTFSRPLSASCHFLSAPKLAEVTFEVRVLRRTRVAESLRVAMSQGDRPVLELMVWTGDELPGYEHKDAEMPLVPSHATLASRKYPPATSGMHTLWQHFDQRSCDAVHWERTQPSVPRQRDWIRLRDYPAPNTAGHFLEAGRFALVLDCFTWPAAGHAHVGDPRFVAPTISLHVDFAEPRASEWLLSDAHSPLAQLGTIHISNRLFAEGGALVASASASLLCRPRPGV